MTLHRFEVGRMVMMNIFGVGMGAGWIGGFLILALVIFAIAALIKYLRS